MSSYILFTIRVLLCGLLFVGLAGLAINATNQASPVCIGAGLLGLILTYERKQK